VAGSADGLGAVGALMVPFDPLEVAAWVARTCQAQGVPVFVSDPGVLSQVRRVVGAGGPGAGPHRGALRPVAPTPPTPG
jgi:hypothetical protein